MPQPPLEELYFTWLYTKVGSTAAASPAKTYWRLLKQLHTKEFSWFVPNDDNRAEDGRDLRQEFLVDEGIASVEEDWLRYGCSMLEMLIALSRRLNFEADILHTREWFWLLIGNLGMRHCNDKSNYISDLVDTILEDVIWRLYLPTGEGGLFPLEHPERDQRNVEIWYQLSAYLLERGY